MRAFALGFSKIRSWLAVPVVALASFASAPAHVQLTCEAPLEAGVGVTEFATLLQFPDRQVTACGGTRTLHHATYLRFTAPQDGWYALHAVPTDSQRWTPRISALPSCASSAEAIFGPPTYSQALSCPPGSWGYFASTTVHLLSGESRIIAVGGDTSSDSGSGQLEVIHIGDTPMDGAQQLTLGSNSFTVAAIEPTVPYQDACVGWWPYHMQNASKFTFTPDKTGDFRFSFCGANRYYVALSDSPDMPYASLVSNYGGCPDGGGRLIAPLVAGNTYYLVVGHPANSDACYTRIATVEYLDPCPADLNDDGNVDGKDLAILISGWGSPEADITGDGTTDGVDLGILLAYWGPCPR